MAQMSSATGGSAFLDISVTQNRGSSGLPVNIPAAWDLPLALGVPPCGDYGCLSFLLGVRHFLQRGI